jgi:hypothetical protein
MAAMAVAMAVATAATVVATAGWARCMAAMGAPCMGPALGGGVHGICKYEHHIHVAWVIHCHAPSRLNMYEFT